MKGSYRQVFCPRCSILAVSDAAFLPSASDHQYLRDEFAVLVSRVITKFLPAFAQFSKFVVQHIIHDHMFDASRKSERNCLGLLELNENKQQDMVEIMSHLDKRYVPYQFEDGDNAISQPLVRLQFGGDQLTAERARNSKGLLSMVWCHIRDCKHSCHMQKTFTT